MKKEEQETLINYYYDESNTLMCRIYTTQSSIKNRIIKRAGGIDRLISITGNESNGWIILLNGKQVRFPYMIVKIKP